MGQSDYYVIKPNCFHDIKSLFETPEHINDSPHTAPSKRIKSIIPSYEKKKTTEGVLIAFDIGLPKLRESCPHFHTWITELENLNLEK